MMSIWQAGMPYLACVYFSRRCIQVLSHLDYQNRFVPCSAVHPDSSPFSPAAIWGCYRPNGGEDTSRSGLRKTNDISFRG